MMTRDVVSDFVDKMWITDAQRANLKYRVRMREFPGDELSVWGHRFQRAVEIQEELVHRHALQAVTAHAVLLVGDGPESQEKKTIIAARILREANNSSENLHMPVALSRNVVQETP